MQHRSCDKSCGGGEPLGRMLLGMALESPNIDVRKIRARIWFESLRGV